MKKIVCLFLVIFIISAVFSCSAPDFTADLDTQEAATFSQTVSDTEEESFFETETETAPHTEASSEEETQPPEEQTTKNPNKIVAEKYDGVFKTGFARVDITPSLDVPKSDGSKMTRVEDPLYATCIAVYDGENTALIYTVDLCNVPAQQYNSIRQSVS